MQATVSHTLVNRHGAFTYISSVNLTSLNLRMVVLQPASHSGSLRIHVCSESFTSGFLFCLSCIFLKKYIYLFTWLCQRSYCVACGIQFPYQGLNLGPSVVQLEVLATEPLGESVPCTFLLDLSQSCFSCKGKYHMSLGRRVNEFAI